MMPLTKKDLTEIQAALEKELERDAIDPDRRREVERVLKAIKGRLEK